MLLETPAGEERIRLPAGQAIVYPSTRLHQVVPVCEGERVVAVGWIESRLRHSEQRELLFELDTARRALCAQEGKGEVFDRISRTYSNLLRWWECSRRPACRLEHWRIWMRGGGLRPGRTAY